MPDEIERWFAKAEAKGRAEGVSKGRADRNEKIAMNLLRNPKVSLSDEFVAQMTGLSIKRVRQLRASLAEK